MPKWILYSVIVVLVIVVGYLIFNPLQYFSAAPLPSSNIELGAVEIIRDESDEMAAQTDELEDETVTPSTSSIAISGTLVRFEEVPERQTGEVVVYAFINDGTEMMSVDMRHVVQPGVSSPQDQLGLTIGSMVTVRGEVVDGQFVAEAIE